ncbi:MAG: DUF378 domain-containing protein [Minisyncoccota bacterium]
MKNFHTIAFVLLIIGGLNWGLVLFGWDIGRFLPAIVSDIIYALVAISALYEAVSHKHSCKHCTVESRPAGMGQM